MRTGETVTDLGLYTSECCSAELIFDSGDRFLDCPQCNHSCLWELEEEIVTLDELQDQDRLAA